jgi:hypothetical protein
MNLVIAMAPFAAIAPYTTNFDSGNSVRYSEVLPSKRSVSDFAPARAWWTPPAYGSVQTESTMSCLNAGVQRVEESDVCIGDIPGTILFIALIGFLLRRT